MYRYLVLTVFILSGCSALTPYKREPQQGQLITTEQLDQIKVGMPIAQAIQILGTPTLVPASNTRVDYTIDQDGDTSLLSLHHDGTTITKIDQ